MRAASVTLRRPTFLIVGAPKCGTTALAAAVAEHRDVHLSAPKEPHFFDAHYANGLDWYMRECYSGWRAQRAAGEATPSYLALPWVPTRISNALPQARIVAVLRHPVERAFSSWWMFHARGMEPLGFEDAIAENERRLVERPLEDDDESRRWWSQHVDAIGRGSEIRIRTYLDSGYYADQLKRYYAAFPREQVLVVLSDELRHGRGTGALNRIFRHIGIDADVPNAAVPAANEAIGGDAVGLLHALRATGLMPLRRLIPPRLRENLKRRLSKRGNAATINDGSRARLVAHFLPHVLELERLLAVDLSQWKR